MPIHSRDRTQLRVLHVNSTSDLLMEPIINTSFDGPQLDEVRAVQFYFGVQLYELTLLVAASLPGGYNQDSTVDTADYVAWRSGLETTFEQRDYEVWRTRFRETAGGGAAAGRCVPSLVPTTSRRNRFQRLS